MDLEEMLRELREGREQVEEAIIALERLERGVSHRGGKRPRWLAAMLAEDPKAQGAKKKPRAKKPPEATPSQQASAG